MQADRAAADRPAAARLQEQHLGHPGRPRAVREGARRLLARQARRRRRSASRVRVLLTGVPMVHGRGAGAGHHRGQRRAGRLHGELHRAEADPGGRRRDGGRSAAGPGREVLPPALLGDDAQRPAAGHAARSWPPSTGPQCVVELVWQACLTYDVESHRVRRLVEEELRLPYLRIETDYSPSDSARIAVRVEALFETVRGGRHAGHGLREPMKTVAYCSPVGPAGVDRRARPAASLASAALCPRAGRGHPSRRLSLCRRHPLRHRRRRGGAGHHVRSDAPRGRLDRARSAAAGLPPQRAGHVADGDRRAALLRGTPAAGTIPGRARRE